MEKIKVMLESKNVTNIKHYTLVNNSGYTFEYKGVKFDLRHWRNVYGAECNFFACWCNEDIKGRPEWIKDFTKEIDREANRILKGE